MPIAWDDLPQGGGTWSWPNGAVTFHSQDFLYFMPNLRRVTLGGVGDTGNIFTIWAADRPAEIPIRIHQGGETNPVTCGNAIGVGAPHAHVAPSNGQSYNGFGIGIRNQGQGTAVAFGCGIDDVGQSGGSNSETGLFIGHINTSVNRTAYGCDFYINRTGGDQGLDRVAQARYKRSVGYVNPGESRLIDISTEAGSQPASFGIYMNGNFSRALWISDAGDNNVSFWGVAGGNFGGGKRVIEVRDAAQVPTGSSLDGVLIYSEAGAGKARGRSGTVTTFAPAEPHCPTCGRDFVLEWANEQTGRLTVCMWCLTGAMQAGVIRRA